MKSNFWVLGLVLAAASAQAADKTVGTATLTIWPEYGAVGAIAVNDNGTTLTAVDGASSLIKTANSVKGFFLNKYIDVSCTATACTGNGPTNLELALTQVTGGYKLDGQIDFYPVTLTVTTNKIEVSIGDDSDTGYALALQSDGSYSGQGETLTAAGFENLQLTYEATGSLRDAVTDPSTAILLLANPFVQ